MIIISEGQKIYDILKETYGDNVIYSFTTENHIKIHISVRLKRGKNFDERNFIGEMIEFFTNNHAIVKNDFKEITKKYNLILDGLEYDLMPDELKEIIQKALNNDYNAEFAMNGVSLSRNGILIQMKNYDSNLQFFTKILIKKGATKKLYYPNQVIDDRDKIIEEVTKLVEE